MVGKPCLIIWPGQQLIMTSRKPADLKRKKQGRQQDQRSFPSAICWNQIQLLDSTQDEHDNGASFHNPGGGGLAECL